MELLSILSHRVLPTWWAITGRVAAREGGAFDEEASVFEGCDDRRLCGDLGLALLCADGEGLSSRVMIVSSCGVGERAGEGTWEAFEFSRERPLPSRPGVSLTGGCQGMLRGVSGGRNTGDIG